MQLHSYHADRVARRRNRLGGGGRSRIGGGAAGAGCRLGAGIRLGLLALALLGSLPRDGSAAYVGTGAIEQIQSYFPNVTCFVPGGVSPKLTDSVFGIPMPPWSPTVCTLGQTPFCSAPDDPGLLNLMFPAGAINVYEGEIYGPEYRT